MQAWLDAHGRAKVVNTDNGIWISLISYCHWWLNLIYMVGKTWKKTRSKWL